VENADFLFVFPDNKILTDRFTSESLPYKVHSPTLLLAEHPGVSNMVEYMLRADIGIISSGITMYEADSV